MNDRNGKPTRRLAMRRFVMAGVLVALGGGVVLTSWHGQASTASDTNRVDQRVMTDPQPLPDRSIGSAAAPVTIVEYASLTCGHCSAFARDVMPSVREKLVDTGKVRFVFRDFPLDPVALATAMIARCVPADRSFDVAEDLLVRQQDWIKADERVTAVAGVVGLGIDEVKRCLGDAELQKAVETSRELATGYGVKATPSFFVNGRLHQGGTDIDGMIALVEEATAASEASR